MARSPDSRAFLKRAWELATGELAEDTLLLVVGSLYMVGEIKDILMNK